MEDRNGNYMECQFIRGAASCRIDRINYGGNAAAGIPCCYSVRFHYSERPDKELSFIGDNTLVKKQILDSIRVMRGYNVLNRYWFEYHAPSLSNGYYYSRLERINFSCGGETYNPTEVQWGTNDYGSYGSSQCHSISVTGGNASDFEGKIKFTGDLNGDGYTDVILFFPDINEDKASGDTGAKSEQKAAVLYINKGLDSQGACRFSRQAGYIELDDNIDWIYTADINGDGLDDIILSNRKRTFIGKDRLTINAYLSSVDDNGSYHLTAASQNFGEFRIKKKYRETLLVGDFLGEGRQSILLQECEDNKATPRLFYISCSGSAISAVQLPQAMVLDADRMFACDFNGDGISEIYFMDEDTESTGLKRMVRSGSSYSYQTVNSNMLSVWHQVFPGDFNGDGKADVAVRTADDQMKFLYGPVREENGQGVFASTQTVGLGSIGMSGVSNQTICTGNFLGRENMGVFSATTVHALNPVSNRYSVTAVTDGMGNRTSFEYDYLMAKPSGASDADFYTRTLQTAGEQSAHMFTVPLPMKGMTRMTTRNIHCEAPVAEVRYRYGNALVHKRGRGFLGFKSTTTENWVASEKRQTVERLSETLFTVPCLALRTETVKKHDGSTASSTENENRVLVKRNPASGVLYKAFVPVVWKQTSLNYDLNRPQLLLSKTITQCEYNDTVVRVLNGTVFQNIHAYDLLKQTALQQGVDSCASVTSASQCEFQTITETTYLSESQADIQNWVVNRPCSVLTTARRLGGYSDVKSLAVSRYPSTGNPFLPTVVESYPSGVESSQDSLATIEERVYSSTGLLKVRSVGDVMSRLPVRCWRYEYSNDGRFMTQEINPAGDTTAYAYDHNYCHLISETDCNGLVTLHARTPLGSSRTTTYPDGRVSHGETVMGVLDDCAPDDTYYLQWDTTSGSGMRKAYYNAAGQKLRTLSQGMDGEAILKDYVYNDMGLLARESLPYFYGDNTAGWNIYRYDDYGRHIITEHPDGMEEVTVYQGYTTWHVKFLDDPDDPPSTATTVNAAGWTVKSVDEERNEVHYDHYADGKLKTTQLGNDTGTAVSVGYDAAGNRTILTDPDYGTVRSVYDAYGQLTLTVSPKGDTTLYQYDILGRMVKRYECNHSDHSVDSTSWLYSNLPGKRGLLTSLDYNGKEQVFWYVYDNLCRLSMVSEMRRVEYYNTYYTYDEHSRLSRITYPSGCAVTRGYTATGHLRYIRDANKNTIWETESKNAWGQVTRYHTGDGVTTERSYDPHAGRLTGILSYNLTDTIQNLSYVYDKNANLASRTDSIRLMEERFTYDLLNRLTGIVEGLDTTGVFAYDDYGRMTMKYIHGDTVFDQTVYNAGGRPHALMTARMHSYQPDMSMAYTSFDKLRQIQYDDFSLSYEYGYDHQRVRMVETLDSDTVFTKKYAGACEFVVGKDGQSSTLTYLSGPLGVFAVLDSHILPLGKGMYYVHPDHLGSWTTVTSRSGTVVQDVWFDPWGSPYYSDSSNWVQAASLFFDRGFTGHEHLMDFGLINMNGRVYDPVTSSFLSVDNYVQDPSYTQNFNRYAYCMNNPLKYTDPDGEWAHLVIGALVGGIVNLATNWGHINTFGEGLAYFGIGAAAGAVGAATGGAAAGAMKLGGFVSGAVSGAAGGASSGFITGSGNAWMQGANFGQGLKAGAIAAGIGAGSGALFGGLTRGIVDYRKGYNFWDGTKITNYEGGTVKLSELYPNNNFNYDNYQIKECADFTDLRLKTRTSQVFGIEQGDMGIELLTTNPNNAVGPSKGYTLLTDGTYQTADGRNSLGYTFETTTGYSEVHVSPYAATHRNTAIFKAVVGHELTHSYHYFVNLPVSELGPSEGAALRYSAKVYQSYGMTAAYEATVKSIQTVPYYPNYAVPNTYTFSLKW